MATGTAESTPIPSPVQASASTAQLERFIESQLDKTRTQVKLVDFFSSLMQLAAGVLGFLLLAALIDAWVFDLGIAGRVLALAALVLGTGWFVATRVAPLIIKNINPAYAAKVIEEAQPSLKNSIINFLLLRSNRAVVHELVFQAVEERAANDLSHVSADAAVDRSRLIKLAYVLAGIVLICGLYKVLSPKDPLQTVARVLAPWSGVSRPARAAIEDVQPGNSEVFFGQTMAVSARVLGARSSDHVFAVYSTQDGQIVHRGIALKPTADGARYQGILSPGEGGIQQDLTYRVSVFDRLPGETEFATTHPIAASDRYRIKVLPAPTITVQSVQYVFPAYTRRPVPPPQSHADIDALEGTKVTITATANLPIKSAYLEFDPLTRGETAAIGLDRESPSPRKTEVIAMQVDGQEARGAFVLELAPDRATPKFKSYQIRFITPEGHQNEQPIVHRISVTRDLPPEIEILSPTADRIEVPLDGRQTIEMRALDPDFALSKVSLRAVSGGADLLDESLLPADSTGLGRSIVNFDFKPADLGLSVGDEVVYWGVAADNRTAPRTGLPEPNIERTRNYYLKVAPPLAPPEGEKKPGDEKEPGEKDGAEAGDKAPPAGEKPKQPERPPEGGEKSATKGETGEDSKAGGEKNPGEKSAEGEGGKKNGPPEAGGEKNGEDKNKEKTGKKSGEEAGKDSEGESGEGSKEAGGKEKKASEKEGGQGNAGGKSGDESGENPAGPNEEQGASGKNASNATSKSGAGERGSPQPGDKPSDSGESGEENGSRSGEGDAASQGAAGNTNRRTGGPGGKESQGASSPEGGQAERREGPLHDGEVIEKVNEHLEQQQGGRTAKNGEKNGENQPAGGADAESPGEKQAGAQQGASNASQTGGERQPGQKQPGAEQSGEKQPGASGSQPDAEKKPGGAQGAESGQPQGGAETKPEGGASGEKPEKQAPGSEGQNGQSGAGSKSESDQGSPASQEENKDREKKPGQNGGGEKSGDEAKSPSQSKKQSDSQGGESGDKSGGGKQGGGQGANQAGNDSAGGNSPGDQGGGAASQPGSGQTANQGGKNGPASEKPTGVSGNQEGEGSATQKGEGGQRPGQGDSPQPAPGEKPGQNSSPSPAGQGAQPMPGAQQGETPQQPGAAQPPQGQPQQRQPQQGERPQQRPPEDKGQPQGAKPEASPQKPEGTASPPPGANRDSSPSGGAGSPDSAPGRGGLGGGGQMNDPANGEHASGELPPEEKANLEYARKATDLALEHLRDQKENPDAKLLEKLGMTKDELARFVERWEGLKKAAKEDPAAKRELDESLRSLGLRSGRDKLRTGGGRNDENKGLLDQGPRSEPPPAYLEQFNAFKRGTTRTEK